MAEVQQDSKAKRYDRQIRIWGPEGQQNLENSRIMLLNCSPTGSETLKNLVLGGLASFTIVDGNKVHACELGNNFLVDSNRLGQSRAQVVTDLLKELNDSVLGSYVGDSPEELLDNNPDFLDSFDLVIATQMREQQLLKLDGLCRSKGVKLLIVRSYGLMGYMRASLPEHNIIASKPDSQVDDLRLTCPWPALLEWCTSFDLQRVDNHIHQHLPYVVLLLVALQAWRASLGPDTPPDRLPANSKEKAALKQTLTDMKRTQSEDCVPLDVSVSYELNRPQAFGCGLQTCSVTSHGYAAVCAAVNACTCTFVFSSVLSDHIPCRKRISMNLSKQPSMPGHTPQYVGFTKQSLSLGTTACILCLLARALQSAVYNMHAHAGMAT
eukprot:GHRR01019026.1.p1 GENE.GHRR01019026.1~~GHRR01019026.1.p1  ORF type:complete len:381 (+),score=78.31 GHRR01019026.1:1545-2687(+)